MNQALHEPGELVWVSVFNSLEDRSSRGKGRPGVLVARQGGHWCTMCLTTNPEYSDGSPRTPIPDHHAVGLNEPGYLWSDHLTPVSAIDIGDHIGFADRKLVETIIEYAGLYGAWAGTLRVGYDDRSAA